VTFDGSASSDGDGKVVDYDWDFGDGTAWSGVTVQKVYSQTGAYEVTLTVTDDGGATGQVKQTVNVEPLAPGNLPPIAVISGPVSGQPNEPLNFSGATSHDPDGGIIGYAWDFGDGTTATGPDVQKAYGQPGTYTVILTVTDDGNLNGQTTQMVTIDVPGSDAGG
jgi:PKD repeat protein